MQFIGRWIVFYIFNINYLLIVFISSSAVQDIS
jgi:hypothetical protein